MADPASSSNCNTPSTSGQQARQQNDIEAQDKQKKISRKRKNNDKDEQNCCTKQRCGFKSVSLETRENLKREYSEQRNTGQGFSYLRRYISPERVTNSHGNRRTTYRYYIPNGEKEIEVCQMAFRMVYGITDRMLRDARDEKGKSI